MVNHICEPISSNQFASCSSARVGQGGGGAPLTIESLMAVLRQVCSNVKRWRDARMALRWTGTAMLEAERSFRRLKAHKQLPVLRAALLRHQQALLSDQPIASKNLAA